MTDEFKLVVLEHLKRAEATLERIECRMDRLNRRTKKMNDELRNAGLLGESL